MLILSEYFYYLNTVDQIMSYFTSVRWMVGENRQVVLIALFSSNTEIKEADEASHKGLGRKHEDLWDYIITVLSKCSYSHSLYH